MRSSWICLVMLAGCGSPGEPSLALTDGVEVALAGCAYKFTTPKETTAPADGGPVRILVAGDSRGNAATWGQVMQAGAAEAPDLAIFTGDANDLGSIQDDWEAWFGAAQGVLEPLPLMMVHGNHEINA